MLKPGATGKNSYRFVTLFYTDTLRKPSPIDLLFCELISSILSITRRSTSICFCFCFCLLRGKVCLSLRCSSNFSGLGVCILLSVSCSSCSSSASQPYNLAAQV